MKISKLLPIIPLVVSGILMGCRGGGGGTANPITTGLSGTASVGAAITNANVILTDVNGKTLTTTTDSNGAYSLGDISTLTPPILVSVAGTVGGKPVTYNSMLSTVTAGSNNIANANPLTDAIVYQAAGQSPANLATTPSAMSSISASAISTAATNVTTALTSVLNGITTGSASGFNPISSSYVADGRSSYDKIYDLLSVYPSSSVGSSNISINIADKSGTNGTVTLASGQNSSSITPLPALPSAIANLAISGLQSQFSQFNSVVATTAGLNSSALSSLISNNFLLSGINKTSFINFVTSSSSNGYALGATLSNPVVNSCNTSGVCQISFNFTQPSGTPQPITFGWIYDQASGKWLMYGDQQPDMNIDFGSFAQLSNSAKTFQVGIGFNILGNIETGANNPYNSAVATFQTSAGTIDYTVYFAQKTSVGGACDPSNSAYNGLPIANNANPSSQVIDTSTGQACWTWVYYNDQAILNTINSHIINGGYQLIVKGYSSNNWTGSPVTFTQNLTTPLLTSSVLNSSMFPIIQAKNDSTGPYLYIPNAADYLLIGSVDFSSSSHSFAYNPNRNVALKQIYRPAPSDNFSSTETIQTYFVHARDKYGRDLRVNQ